MAGAHEVRLQNTWSFGAGGPAAARSRVRISIDGGAGREIYSGPAGWSTLATREDAVLVGLLGSRPRAFVTVLVAPIVDGRIGEMKRIDLRPAGGPAYAPTTIIACDDHEGGFSVMWQELNGAGLSADARTSLGRVAPDGRVVAQPAVVPVPWAIAGIVRRGPAAGYHLALFYDGEGPGRTRVSPVTLSVDGNPEQHPWWATEAAAIEDVQLVLVGGAVNLWYRGGQNGDEVAMRDITAVGQWGSDPGQPRSLGRIPRNDEMLVERGGGFAARTGAEFP
jgi:hypothetical protein